MGNKAGNNFININKDFWARFKESETDNLLLVETSEHPAINHANAVTGKMVAGAKGFKIAWLEYDTTDEKLMKSYSENAVFLRFKKYSVFFKLYLAVVSAYLYLAYVLALKKLLTFKYKGIPYGDFVYDGYLAMYSVATMHRFDIRMIRVFYIVLLRDTEARDLLKRYKIKGILVAHYMNIGTGILSRVALQKEMPVYWKGRGHELFNLYVFKKLDEIYNYPMKPTVQEIDLLCANQGKIVEEEFNNFIKESAGNAYSSLTIAYNNNIRSDITKEQFLKEMGLKAGRPVVFVMLHAFNDYPHSHFKSMIFDDFYDWFVQTYNFAMNDKNNNWIFKEHPLNRFYPTKDIDLDRFMGGLPEHIKFISQNHTMNSSVVLNVADLIVTCLGTAGVEMPALRAIPSLIASDTFYDGFGFTVEPRSKKDYFDNFGKVTSRPLTQAQQLRAKACYLYLYKYCMMPFAAGPFISVEEMSTNPQAFRDSYAERVEAVYKKDRDLIYSQFYEYAEEIKKDDFKKLVRLPLGLTSTSDSFVKLFTEVISD